MNSEIVAIPDGTEIPSVDTSRDSNAIRCTPQGSRGAMEDILPFDLMDLFSPKRPWAKFDLMGGDYHTSQFVANEMVQKHVTQLNPTLDTLKPILEKIKEPSVLMLQGCDQLLLGSHFPFGQFSTLTALEISSSCRLTNIPVESIPVESISQMKQLQSLHLSGLFIEELPRTFFSNLTKLRYLVLRSCPKLSSLPSIHTLGKLEVLDLAYCSALQYIGSLDPSVQNLRMLDLSYIGLLKIPFIGHPVPLTHIFFRDAKVPHLKKWIGSIVKLRVIDLSGSQKVENVNWLNDNHQLEVVDLSKTSIKSIHFLRSCSRLRILLLRECTRLSTLEAMEKLINLEVLDLSGCVKFRSLPKSDLTKLKELNLSGCSGLTKLRKGFFDQMSCLEKLDLSKTKFDNLPSFANLINLQTLSLSQTLLEKVPDLPNLINLKVLPDLQTTTNSEKQDFDLPGSGGIDFIKIHPSGMRNLHPRHLQHGNTKRDEFHLVSTFITGSIFDQFKYKSTKLDDLISNIQNYFNCLPTTIQDVASDITYSSSNKGIVQNPAFKRQIDSLHADLGYLRKKIDLLESSPDSENTKDLLHWLMDVADRRQADDFTTDDSTNLMELLRVVARLKILVPRPPKQVDGLKKKVDDIDIKRQNKKMQSPLVSYVSLTDIQRNCLLYFASIPCEKSGDTVIKKRILIQLWYSEGLLDPISYANSSKGLLNLSTFEETGLQIVEALLGKKFISVEQEALLMSSWKRSFLMEQAINCKQLTEFQRAYLLKAGHKFPSSCKLWANYTNSSEKLHCPNKICTLFNFDETIINIEAEWLSKMRNLSVLCLGSWKKHIDVADLMFLEELKNMKQLKLLSLEGFSGIMKLPDSVCMVTSLNVLNLRHCAYLKELPARIGSLKHLTYLDVTNCCHLSDLPKGIKFLTKLQVLKGFVITYKPSGSQNKKACTLRDLSMLEDLRNLSLLVNNNKFPDREAVHALWKMKNLHILKITWEKHYCIEQEPEGTVGQSRWLCWEPCASQNETDEPSDCDRFDSLKKLVLRCFPLENPPDWLHPSKLQKLEKLYILGGNLKTIPGGGTNQDTWSVKTLHLKYLRNLEMDWQVLRQIFSNMTYFQKHEYPHIRNFIGRWNDRRDKLQWFRN